MIPHYNSSFCGPSSILWFFIGAATANWLLPVKRTDSDSRIFGHCRRLHYQAPLPNSSVPDGALSDGTTSNRAPSASSSWCVAVRDISRTLNNIPHWGTSEQQQQKEHLTDISRKVADAMTDLTEATLESVVSATEALKAKLTEHRTNREQQQSIIEEQIQKTRNSPPPA